MLSRLFKKFGLRSKFIGRMFSSSRPTNLVAYNATYDPWGGAGVTKDATGVTMPNSSAYSSYTVSVDTSTEYLSLLRIVTNGTAGTFVSLGNIANSFTVATAGVTGYRKNIFTTKATIGNYGYGFYPNANGGIKIAEMRLFKSTPALRADWDTLTPDQLNAKYPV